MVEALALRLIEKERVVHKDLVEILGERPFEARESYAKYIQHEAEDESKGGDDNTGEE
jgi:hypothetical protein